MKAEDSENHLYSVSGWGLQTEGENKLRSVFQTLQPPTLFPSLTKKLCLKEEHIKYPPHSPVFLNWNQITLPEWSLITPLHPSTTSPCTLVLFPTVQTPRPCFKFMFTYIQQQNTKRLSSNIFSSLWWFLNLLFSLKISICSNFDLIISEVWPWP